jgi:hypothetical protein
MKLIATPFETPVTEEWEWSTNTLVSDNGTEQRIQLLDPPKRSLQVSYMFADVAETQRMMRTLFMSQTGFLIPTFHAAAKIAPAAIGAQIVAFNPARTELRDGDEAMIFDRVTLAFERVTIVHVGAATATLAAGLARKWGAKAMIAPLWAFVAADNASLSRNRPDGLSTVSFSLAPLAFVDPFLNPANVTELDTFAGLPLLPYNATGDEFSDSYSTGAELISYGGAVQIRSPWQHTQVAFSRTYLCKRIIKRSDWAWWNAFADYCKGSQNPFYVPTFRPDFALSSFDEAHVSLKGVEYAQDYYSFAPFKQFALFNAAGARHYCSATACGVVGGESLVTIAPPLPAGFVPSKVSLLLKARIADDKVSCQHSALDTMVSLNMRTVDE